MFSDHHAPHNDKWLHHLSLEYIESAQPARIIFNGDVANLDAIKSRKYKADPHNDEGVMESIRAASQIVWDVRRRAPTADILWQDGNHEVRWENWLASQAPEVQHDPEFDLGTLLKLGEMGVKRVLTARDYGYPFTGIMLGSYLEVAHGWMARAGSVASVKSMLDAIGYAHSLLVGHTHTIGMYAKTIHETTGDRVVLGIEGGTMAEISWGLGYSRTRNWQNAFTRIDMNPSGMFTYRPVIYSAERKELYG